jgi:glycosyltransferase involved in cell wall biosynthesis
MQKWAYRRILNKIKYYHALNSYDAQLVKDNIPNAKPYLVPGFAEFKNNKLPFNKNEFTVLWVGRLDKYQKGVDLFCDVVEKVLAKETSIKFRVYGGGEDGEPLIKALVSRHGKNVEWPGFVPYAKVKEGYKDANLLAFTARGEELRYFPLVFLEGQALGLPIVVFDGKGYKGIITDNVEGSLIKPFNTDDFANAILKYYKIWKASKNDYIKLKKKISVLTKEKFGDEVIIPKMAKMLTPNDK